MARSLKVLVVDDEPVAQLTLKRFLRQRGHEPVTAKNGLEAIEKFESEHPDLVLMDVSMPVMDGYEATARIRKLCGERWVPVIFLSAESESQHQVRGLDVGGDDYVIKPVNLVILEAKLRAMQRTVDMQRSLADHADQLARYREANESELRLAKHLMERLIRSDQIDSDTIRSWLVPAQSFSGDVLAAARTAGGAIHLLLADGTGHGLGAALTVMPVIDAFYDLTAKGFSISGVVRRLNQQVRLLLPRERFVAATLVSISETGGSIDVWNGGNPEAVLLSDEGEALHVWESRHPALGVVSDDEFEADTEPFRSNHPAEFYMWSDGLVEAEDAEGRMFGFDGVLRVLREGPVEDRLDRLAAAACRHQGRDAGTDDISVLRARCGVASRAGVSKSRGQADPLPVACGKTDWRLDLRVGSEELKSADVLPVIVGWLDQLSLSEQQRADVGLVVTELFANALDHGVLGLQSDLKEQPDGFVVYMDQRMSRLTQLQEGAVEVHLETKDTGRGTFLEIRVRDTGPGFDARTIRQDFPLEDLTARSGRGVALVSSICERVEYRGSGNEVAALYRLN